MRDSHNDMIELLGAENAANIFSSIIKHEIGGELLKLRFGIISSDFSRLKRILEFRPYENTGVAPYRYFFALSYRNDPENEDLAFIAVRVEQLDRHKQYEFLISKKYISNLRWFDQLTDKNDVEKLIEQ
ncbi:MAG: hypothetical protein ACJA2M_002677 [Polaribacter sp.]|jgi:hypothetical protein